MEYCFGIIQSVMVCVINLITVGEYSLSRRIILNFNMASRLINLATVHTQGVY